MRANPDRLLLDIADFVVNPPPFSEEAYETASYALLDSMGCAILSLTFPECVKRIKPLFENGSNGVLIPGTDYRLNPIEAAFSIGSQIRWLDFNDTWLGKEWGHPSDNLGALLAVISNSEKVSKLLEAMIKCYEIQGILALSNSFNRVGLDHVILVKLASTAVSTHLIGGSKEEIINSLSNAFADLGPLRCYRHQPNVGPRKSWAAGDACSRAVFHAFRAVNGEIGYPTVLSAPKWGLEAVLFEGKPLTLTRPLSDYVMRHILFKIAFPAEFHAQTAVEASFQLHPLIRSKIDDIERIDIETHESAIRIIDKKGPLHNPADRDHCLQYMVAVGLIKGSLVAEDYEAEMASHPHLDKLREKMVVRENMQFSKDYLDPDKRTIANSLQITFKDGSQTAKIVQEYPLGHRTRRKEGIPKLKEKFEENIRAYPPLVNQISDLMTLFQNPKKLQSLTMETFRGFFLPV